jgi:predicted dehydrogenase
MVNIAIIGAGHIGEVHANAIKKVKNAKVVAVSDSIESKGLSFAKKFKVKFYNDYDEILSNREIDVIAICAPTFLHAEMVIKAARAKKNIFCEKPLAMNNEEAKYMLEAVNNNNVKAMTAHVLRFWPAYMRIKEIVESGEIGKILHIYCERLMPIPPWVENGWNKNEKLSGGAAIDIQIHDIDYILWLLGEPEMIKSSGIYDKRFGGWSHIGTNLEFKTKQVALIQAGWGFPGSFPFTNVIRVVCEEGTVEWTSRMGMDSWNKSEKMPIITYKNNCSPVKESVDESDPFVNEWSYYIDRLQSGKEIEKSSFKDGALSLKVVLSTIDSAKKFETIKLN